VWLLYFYFCFYFYSSNEIRKEARPCVETADAQVQVHTIFELAISKLYGYNTYEERRPRQDPK
jgi:hypothetical protein